MQQTLLCFYQILEAIVKEEAHQISDTSFDYGNCNI